MNRFFFARRLVAAALLLTLLMAGIAYAQSTINPNIPAQNAQLNSAPLRGNFAAAYNDITNLLGQFAGPIAPSSPVIGQIWRQTNVTPQIVWQWDGGTWDKVATFDNTAHKITPFFGNSLLSWQQLLTGAGGLGTSGQCLTSTGGSSVPTTQDCVSPGSLIATSPLSWNPGTQTISCPTCATSTFNTAAITANNDTNVTLTLGGSPSTSVLNAVSLSLGWSGQLAVNRGGTACAAASGTCLDNITSFSSTGFLVRTGAGAYAFQSAIALSQGGLGASQIAATAGQVPIYPGSSGAAVPGSLPSIAGTATPAQLGGSPASHGALIDVSGTPTWKIVPDCQDSAGNHINYTQSTDVWACGTSVGGSSPWTNTRLAKTSAYSAVTGDCGDTIALGGSAFYVLTISAASGYTSTCVFQVVNEDTTRGKAININGLQGFVLWPLQSVLVYNQNNVWHLNPSGQRWKLLADQTWNVNHGSGLDAVTCTGSTGGTCPNDGLGTGSGAYATINNAVLALQNTIDCNGHSPTIKNVDETFTENVAIRGASCLGFLELFITGNPATPDNVVWQTGGSNIAMSVRDGTTVTLNGFKLAATGSGAIGLYSSQFADIDFLNMDFGAFASGTHLLINAMGSMNCVTTGTYQITGNFNIHLSVQGPSNYICAGATINLPSALTFGNFLVGSGAGAFAQFQGSSFTGTGSGAGSTGAKYNLNLNSVALTGGLVLPGATAGSAATGAQYN